MGIVKGLLDTNLRILSTLIVILSVVLLAKGSKLGYIEMPTEDAGCIFAYGILTLVLAFCSGIPLMANPYGFIYQAAAFMQLFMLWNIDFDSDPDYLNVCQLLPALSNKPAPVEILPLFYKVVERVQSVKNCK